MYYILTLIRKYIKYSLQTQISHAHEYTYLHNTIVHKIIIVIYLFTLFTTVVHQLKTHSQQIQEIIRSKH